MASLHPFPFPLTLGRLEWLRSLCFLVAWLLSAARYFILMCLYKRELKGTSHKISLLSEC